MIVDTHCHLYYEDLFNNLDEILSKSSEAGLEKIIVPAVDIDTSLRIADMAERYPMIYAAVGIHPCDIKSEETDILENLIPLLDRKKVAAIGETGLDYYWDKSNMERQKEFFRLQIELAAKYNLPLIVHSRDSIEDTIRIIRSNYKDGLKIHMHCFSGSAKDAISLISDIDNIYFSFCGNVTYKNFRDTEALISIPGNRLLFETDSPFLTPVPYRGKTNFPYHIIHTIKKISEIKGIPENILIPLVRENTKKIYGI